MQRMRHDGIEIMTGTKVKEFLSDGIIVEKNGNEETIRNIDRIVLAMGARSTDHLSKTLDGKVKEIHVIGDAKMARNLLSATKEAADVGREI